MADMWIRVHIIDLKRSQRSNPRWLYISKYISWVIQTMCKISCFYQKVHNSLIFIEYAALLKLQYLLATVLPCACPCCTAATTCCCELCWPGCWYPILHRKYNNVYMWFSVFISNFVNFPDVGFPIKNQELRSFQRQQRSINCTPWQSKLHHHVWI